MPPDPTPPDRTAARRDLHWYEALPFVIALGLQQSLVAGAHRIQAILLIALVASLYALAVTRSRLALILAALAASSVAYSLT